MLTTFPPSLSRKAARSLESLGVTLLLQRTVVDIDEEAVTVAAPDGATERISALNAIWAAGVEASSWRPGSVSCPARRSIVRAG